MEEEKTSKQIENEWEKHSAYHIETEGLEKVLTGAFHMIQTVSLRKNAGSFWSTIRHLSKL